MEHFIWNVNPNILELGPLQLRWYGLLFVGSFFLGLMILTRIYKREGKDPAVLDAMLIYIMAGAVLGSRLVHCLFYEPDYYLKNPLEILKIWKGGLASHGWAIGILLALWLYYRKYKIPFLWLLDRLVIVVALGCAFIRIGNFLNSEIYGLPTNLPWGVEFVRDRLYDSTTGALLPTVPRHPTQLYEALSYFLIFIASFFFYRKRNMEIRDGFMFSVFMIALFCARFLIEFVKNDQVAFEAGMSFNMGQLLSLPFIFAGIVMIVWTKAKPRYFSQEQIA